MNIYVPVSHSTVDCGGTNGSVSPVLSTGNGTHLGLPF